MALTARDRILMLLLPTLAVLALYVAFFSYSAYQRLTKAQARLTKAQRDAVPPTQVLEERAQFNQLQKQVQRLRQNQEDLQAELSRLREELYQPMPETEQMAALTDLFRKHRLHWEKSQLLEQAKAPGMQRLEEWLTPNGKTGAVPSGGTTAAGRKIYEIQFWGEYPDVMALLVELQTRAELGVAVAIAMDETDLEAGARHWSLQMWL